MITLQDYQQYLQFSLDEYREFQLTYLKNFVRQAAQESKHYKEQSIKAEINSYEEFAQLPLLDQENLKEKDIEEFRACSWEDICTLTRSSGTTGKSKIVLWSHESLAWEKKWGSLGLLLSGLTSGSRYAILMPLEMSRISSIIGVCESIGATAIPIGRITSEVDEYNAIELIRRTRATHILATPTRLHSIGNKIKDSGLDMQTDIQTRHLITGGIQSTDIQRSNLEEMWQADIFEQAGANELSYIGFECKEHNGLHILPGSHYVEVIDQKTGKPILDSKTQGEVLITAFSNLATPLLRYRIGDLGYVNYERCDCGLSFPRLFIRGRTIGTISLGGTKIYSYQIENILQQFLPQISLNYKVRAEKQGNADLITVLIEASKTSIKDKDLPKQISDTFFNDSASIYKILNKIKAGEVKLEIKLVAKNSLERSSGDKIKKQFEDLRQGF